MSVDLLRAVDELTKPSHLHHQQKDDTGRWVRTHTTRLDPLLTRLRAAADPDGAGQPSAASTGLARVPANLTAIFQDAKIAADVRAWCRIRDVEYTRPPAVDTVTDLRRWYTSTLADNTFDPAWHVKTLWGWVHAIEDLLNPPVRPFEAHWPCPVCGTVRFGDAINGGGWAVEVRYDLDDDGRMSNERALCRKCHTCWTGHGALLELAEEMNEKGATA